MDVRDPVMHPGPPAARTELAMPRTSCCGQLLWQEVPPQAQGSRLLQEILASYFRFRLEIELQLVGICLAGSLYKSPGALDCNQAER